MSTAQRSIAAQSGDPASNISRQGLNDIYDPVIVKAAEEHKRGQAALELLRKLQFTQAEGCGFHDDPEAQVNGYCPECHNNPHQTDCELHRILEDK